MKFDDDFEKNVDSHPLYILFTSCFYFRMAEASIIGDTTDSVDEKSSLLHVGSDELIDPYCETCFENKNKKIRVVCMCEECNIFMCMQCHDVHKQMHFLQKHRVVRGSKMPKSLADKPIKYSSCELHSGTIKDRYCRKHHVMLCSECLKQNHQRCHVDTITDLCKILGTDDINSFTAVVANIKLNVQNTQSKLQNNIANLTKERKNEIKRAEQVKQDMIQKANEMYNETVSGITKHYHNKVGEIKSHIVGLNDELHKLDEIINKIKRRVSVKFDPNLFIQMQQIVDTTQTCKRDIDDMISEIKTTKISFSFSKEISDFLSCKRFGDIQEISSPLSITDDVEDIFFPYITSQASRPHISSQSSRPYITSQAGRPYITSQVGRPYITSQSSGPYITLQVGRPHITLQAGRPHITLQAGRPYITLQAGRPYITLQAGRLHSSSQASRPHSSSQASRPHISSQASRPHSSSQSSRPHISSQAGRPHISSQASRPHISSQARSTTLEKKDAVDISHIVTRKMSHMNIRSPKDNNKPQVNGLAVTDNGTLLVADYTNRTLKVFSQDNTLLSSVPLSAGCWDVTVTEDDIAVVSTHGKKLHYLDTSDPPTSASVQRSVTLGYIVWGIATYKDKLVVTTDTTPPSVRMIDMNGKDVWSVTKGPDNQQLFVTPLYIVTSKINTTETVIVSDYMKETLTLLNANNGSLLKIVDMEGKDPRGITVDNAGNIFVACYTASEICVWSNDFTKSRTLISPKDLGRRPDCIEYRRSTDTLYIRYFGACDYIERFQLSMADQ